MSLPIHCGKRANYVHIDCMDILIAWHVAGSRADYVHVAAASQRATVTSGGSVLSPVASVYPFKRLCYAICGFTFNYEYTSSAVAKNRPKTR